jgi:hypothetical protein
MHTDRPSPGGRTDPSTDHPHPPADQAEQGSTGDQDRMSEHPDARAHQRTRGGDSGDDEDAALVSR